MRVLAGLDLGVWIVFVHFLKEDEEFKNDRIAVGGNIIHIIVVFNDITDETGVLWDVNVGPSETDGAPLVSSRVDLRVLSIRIFVWIWCSCWGFCDGLRVCFFHFGILVGWSRSPGDCGIVFGLFGTALGYGCKFVGLVVAVGACGQWFHVWGQSG